MRDIRRNAVGALQDASLQGTLRQTLANSIRSRSAAVSEVENWEELREYARQVKQHTLDRLSEYLLRLEKQVQAAGGEVMWAADDKEAARIILEIASAESVKTVVKSKTMLGEEIRLNESLQKQGIETVETDLGEYIVQLSGEAPFHIVTPAMHKSRGEVSELFSEKLGVAPTDDVEQLTATARTALRQRFISADLGISGVNFGVAETGTIVVVENEGNARLSMSMPRVHIALMGIEKVIPRLQDLPVFLKLLTRSGTGQKITSYINLISGPRRKDERDGPDRFVLVLVDNGRSRIWKDPFLRQTLSCIRCGACLNACPVFQRIGGHAYDSVYQGPIGAILTPQLLSAAEAGQHPFASSLCGACQEVCPVKIEIPEILLHLRGEIQSRHPDSFLEKLSMRIWSWFNRSDFRFRVAGYWLRKLYPLAVRSGRPRVSLPPVSKWAEARDLPDLPGHSFRELYRKGRR